MNIEAILENYINNPKWEGKIFMEDEKTCYKDGFNEGVESCQFKIEQLKAQIERLKRKMGVMQSCYFNSCIGCNDKKCEVEE